MTRIGVDQLLFILDDAFERNEEHNLLKNIESVRDEHWYAAPPGGDRSIASIVEHVGECKVMYANYGFEDGAMSWHQFDSRYQPQLPPKREMVEWLREAHTNLRAHVDRLADSELTVQRKAPWGSMYETRWLISVMIEHDLYHTGEINTMRGLLEGTDAWPKYDD